MGVRTTLPSNYSLAMALRSLGYPKPSALFINVNLWNKIDEPSVENYRAAIRPNTKLLYAETPSNPALRCVDLSALATLAQSKGIATAVDSTFASPALQQPIAHGIDLVIHSCTSNLTLLPPLLFLLLLLRLLLLTHRY